MQRVLVSSCLLGRKVRYNGSDKSAGHPVLERWQQEGLVVPLCPEIAVGFPTPRPPAEIVGASDGVEILDGHGWVKESTGRNVTDLYLLAGQIALDVAREQGCAYAVLTNGSPSCGSTFIYDGSFQGGTLAGRGTTAALLERNGIRVFPETQIDELDRLISSEHSSRS